MSVFGQIEYPSGSLPALPDLAHCDFFHFPRMKITLEGNYSKMLQRCNSTLHGNCRPSFFSNGKEVQGPTICREIHAYAVLGFGRAYTCTLSGEGWKSEQ